MFVKRLAVISIVHLLIVNYSWVTCTECNTGDYAADPSDCNGFLQCQFGRWAQRNCPRDLHFNPVNFVCDFPWNANCLIDETTTTTTTPDDPPTSTPSPTTAPTPTPTPTPETTTSEPTTSEPTTSEPTTSEPTTSEPTTSEPTTSEPTTSEPTTSEPTTPEPTTSEPTTSEPTTPEPTEPTTTTTSFPTVPPTATSTTSPTSPPTATTTPLPTSPPFFDECPTIDGPDVVHLPHPNCSMFYKCVHGIPHEMLCPFTQRWAMFLDRCERQSVANCVDGAAREQENARPPNYW